MTAVYRILVSAISLLVLSTRGVWTLSFTAEPEDGIVPAGSSVTLHCIVDQRDSASATYIWYRNGKSLSNDKVYTMVAGDLTISVPAGIKDYGKYDGTFHCLVSNKVGQLRSRDASVVVSRSTAAGHFGPAGGQQTRFVPHKDEIVAVVQEGYFTPHETAWHIECTTETNAQISCPSTACNLTYTIYPIDGQKSMSVLLMTLPQLRQLTTSSTCTSFSLTSKWDKNNLLHAKFVGREFPPRRIVLPVDTNAVAGKDVVLPCHGNRVSSYSWTKNDVVLDANANPRITIRGGDLHIKSVTKSDAGEYVCTPSIAAKSKKTTATLAVYSAPSVILSVHRGMSQVTVTCTVSGSPEIKAILLVHGLQKVNVTLKAAPHNLERSLPLDAKGLVQCVASNKFGSLQTSRDVMSSTVSPTTSVPDVTTSSPTRKETSTQVDVKETIDTHTHPPTTPKIEKEQQTDSSKRLNEQQDSNTVTNETQVSKSKEFDTTTKEDQSTTADHDGQTVQQDSTSSTSQPPVGIEQLPASNKDKSSHGLTSGAAAGIAVATIVVLAIIVIGLVLWKRKQSKTRIMWDVKTARYGTVLQNPALGDLDDLQEPKTDNSDAKKSANLSRVGVNDDAAATISIGAESNPVLGKHNSSVSYGTPDHITVGEELYAISTKSRSNTPKPTTNKSEAAGYVLHYQKGDDEYPIAMKQESSDNPTMKEDLEEESPYAEINLDDIRDEPDDATKA